MQKHLFQFVCGKKAILLSLACFSWFLSVGQIYNTEKKWLEQPFKTDPRIDAEFLSTMRNVGGYEGTTLIVKNLTDKSIYVELKLHITDNCGDVQTFKINSTIKAKDRIGGSTWMGGSEQNHYDSKCESTKYGEWQYSKIKKVALEVVKIEELGNKNGGPGTDGDKAPGGTKDNDETGGNGGKKNDCEGTITSTCPAIGLTISNGPALNCVQLQWIEQSTIQFNDKSNEIKTNSRSTNFILQYRKFTENSWRSQNVSGYQMGYNLKMLDPCTKYEIRLQRNCGNGQVSDFSNTLTFTTTCPMPSTVRAQNITSTSAMINSMYSPGVNVCSMSPKSITVQIDYAAPGGNWQTVLANMGTGGSVLYNLQPNTSYRARVRFDYGNGIYSKYSNEIVFKTLN